MTSSTFEDSRIELAKEKIMSEPEVSIEPVCDTCEECVAEFWWGKQLWCSDCLGDHIASLPAEDDN